MGNGIVNAVYTLKARVVSLLESIMGDLGVQAKILWPFVRANQQVGGILSLNKNTLLSNVLSRLK